VENYNPRPERVEVKQPDSKSTEDKLYLDKAEITIGDGTKINAVIVEQDITRDLALVDYKTVKRLAKMLPSANFNQIKRDFIDELDECKDLKTYITVLSDELAFQTSVNMLAKAEVRKINEL
tara:strand:+ start:203 stop:568 length:366 start_codon:yes stop_codon:yes gene_type:complete